RIEFQMPKHGARLEPSNIWKRIFGDGGGRHQAEREQFLRDDQPGVVWRWSRLHRACENWFECSAGQGITERFTLDRCPPIRGGCGNATNRFLSVCVSRTRHAY